MGYYTRYTLEVRGPDDARAAYRDSRGGPATYGDGVHWSGDYAETDKTKWYEHESDMLAVSERHPFLLFVLRGDGEEAGDVWVKFFRAGKVEEHRLDPSTLPDQPSKV